MYLKYADCHYKQGYDYVIVIPYSLSCQSYLISRSYLCIYSDIDVLHYSASDVHFNIDIRLELLSCVVIARDTSVGTKFGYL